MWSSIPPRLTNECSEKGEWAITNSHMLLLFHHKTECDLAIQMFNFYQIFSFWGKKSESSEKPKEPSAAQMGRF